MRNSTTVSERAQTTVPAESSWSTRRIAELEEVLREVCYNNDLYGDPQWPGSPVERRARRVLGCTCFDVCPSENGLLCPTSASRADLEEEYKKRRLTRYGRELQELNHRYADVLGIGG